MNVGVDGSVQNCFGQRRETASGVEEVAVEMKGGVGADERHEKGLGIGELIEAEENGKESEKGGEEGGGSVDDTRQTIGVIGPPFVKRNERSRI